MLPPDPPPLPRPSFVAPAPWALLQSPAFRAALAGWLNPPPSRLIAWIAYMDGHLVIRPR